MLLSHIFLDIALINSCTFLFPSCLKSGEFFFISASTDKCLFFALYVHFHTFMTFWTAGIGRSGNCFFVSTFSVLAYQHLCILSIHCEKFLTAVRTDFICEIIMAERSLSGFNLIHDIAGIVSDFFQECLLFHFTFGNISKFHLPVCCQFWFAKFLRYQFQKLFCFRSQIYFFSFFLHHETVKQLLNDISSRCNSSKATGLTESLYRFRIMAFHKAYRVLHSRKQGCFCKSCRWFCFSYIYRHILYTQFFALFHLRKFLIFQLLRIVRYICVFLICVCVRIFVHFFPSCTFYNFTTGGKEFSCCQSFHTYLLINKWRIKYT